MASASGGPGPTAASGGPGPAAASAGLLAAVAGGWPGVAPGSIGGRPLLDLREPEGARLGRRRGLGVERTRRGLGVSVLD